jgi:hypothetical protein
MRSSRRREGTRQIPTGFGYISIQCLGYAFSEWWYHEGAIRSALVTKSANVDGGKG